MDSSRFREWLGNLVQLAGGLFVGGVMAIRVYPMIDFRLRRVFGTDTPEPTGGGIGTAGYWAAWIISFCALVAIGVALSRVRRVRLLGVTATTFFVVCGIAVSLLFIAFDFGGAPHPD
ncbi:hypothetical protein [Nocardia sp. NPDC004722]